MERIREAGRSYLDAFVVQEQMIVRYNAEGRPEGDLVAIYPVEGTLWKDHPLGLVEHPERTDGERLAYQMFKDYLLSEETQRAVLRHGYRPSDLSIPLDDSESPINPGNGVDPAKPYTTLQIPSAAVIEVVKDVWWQTKRRSNVYLVVDVSGSMEGVKLADARDALRSYLAQVQGEEERVGLIAFGNSAQVVYELRMLGEQGVRSDLTETIAELDARGNTALLDGVDLALTRLQDLADAERINAILVMTDGRENRSRVSLDELVAKLGRSGEDGSGLRVVVFCIAYGADADTDMLRALSDPTGGFTRRGDPETIESLYETLSTYF
jgi:Ca-activated chloride channel family protein